MFEIFVDEKSSIKFQIKKRVELIESNVVQGQVHSGSVVNSNVLMSA